MTAWQLNFDPKQVAQACTDSSAVLEQRLACWSYALNQLQAAGVAQNASLLCSGYTGETLTYCKAHNKDTLTLPAEAAQLDAGVF